MRRSTPFLILLCVLFPALAFASQVPGPPIIDTVTPGNQQVTVSFTPPGFSGYSSVTSYTATAYSGGSTSSSATNIASPITVYGLTNGISYTFKVTASNQKGESAPSADSSVVTPSNSGSLHSHFFSSDSTALQIMTGASYDMGAQSWYVNGKIDRSTFAFKIAAGLFMLGYQTEMYDVSGLSKTHVALLKAFQARNGLPVTSLLDSVCLGLLDQQLVIRESLLLPLAQSFPPYPLHMQPLDANNVSLETPAAIYAVSMNELPANLQMSPFELVQCITGQCVGFIQNPLGVQYPIPPAVDLSWDYRFVGAYFDLRQSNGRMPSAAVDVATVLHEYAHYLDGIISYPHPDGQTHIGGVNTLGFYSIGYDLSKYKQPYDTFPCYPPKSSDVKDWITYYGFVGSTNSCAPGTKMVLEDWADSFMMYVSSGRDFRAAALQSTMVADRYNWLKENVFNGVEYDTDLAQGSSSGCNDTHSTQTGKPGYAHCDDNYVFNFSLPHGTVNGSCGSAISSSFVSPPTSNLCVSGAPSKVDGNVQWTWSCNGLNGGSSQQCSANIKTGNAPGLPANVVASAGNSLAVVTFTAPDFLGDGPITGYTVTSIPAGGIDSNAGSTSLSHTVTGLTNGVSYRFTVAARNDYGYGLASTPSNSVIPLFKLVSENFDGMTSPLLPAGWQSLFSNYSEYCSWKTSAGTGAPAGVTAHSANNMVYFNAFESPYSCSSRLVSPSFSLAGVVGAKIRFWMYRDNTLNAQNGGNSTVDVYISPSTSHLDVSAQKVVTLNRNYTRTAAETAPGWYYYQYSIPSGFTGTVNYLIFNGVWLGSSGDSSNILLDDIEVVSSPGAPVISGVTAGNGQATVSFQPPLNDGGSTITGYTVTSSPDGLTATGFSSPLTVTGLANGTPYTFTVTATNAVGTSLPSSPSLAVIPATVPDAPSGVSAIPGNGTALVSFSLPVNDGGVPISGYTVTSTPGNITASWLNSPITVSGLANGTTYTFSVTASNAAGTSAASTPSGSVTPLLSYDFPTIGGTPPAIAIRDKAYSFTPTSTKATTFSMTGTLPTGLSFDAGSGTISGIPTVAGESGAVTITAHNAVTDANGVGSADLAQFTISVKLPLPTIEILGTIPDGTVGASYSGFYITTTNTVSLSVTQGSLPPGLAISSTVNEVTGFIGQFGAEIGGTPTDRGLFDNIIITASNSDWSVQLSRPFAIQVRLPKPTIFGRPATIGMVGLPYYTFQPEPCKTDLPFNTSCNATVFSISEIPPGLTFDPATGALSGTPSSAGTYGGLTITAKNADGSTSLPEFTLQIAPAIYSFNNVGLTGNDARQYHTSTILGDGRVLIAGGANSASVPLASANVYDPVTGSWSPAGSMNVARQLHSATLLNNGSVLVAGGYGSDGLLKSAELYDPAQNAWSPVADMPNGHSRHTATRLADAAGNVLVAGGFDDIEGAYIAAVDVYDTALAEWKSVTPMSVGRFGFTSTLLASGKVLFAGGGGDSAEIYDPIADSWSTTLNPMIVNRSGHSATALQNGKILISGGIEYGTGDYLASAELYDHVQDSWSSAGSMSAVRQYHTSTLLSDGRVLVTGGTSNWGESNWSVTPISFAEMYNPVSNNWSVAGSMSIPRTNHAATLLQNGNVLVTGGWGGAAVLAGSEAFHVYTVSTSAGSNGSITPSQTVVRSTDSLPVVISPDLGYMIAGVTIDGVSQTISDPQLFSQTFLAVTANHAVSATFVKGWSLTISLISSGGGVGWVTDGGSYMCDVASCSSLTYPEGSRVILNEFTDSNSVFTGWSIQACGSSTSCEVPMTVAQSVSAGFDRLKWAKIENKVQPYYGLLANAYRAAVNGDIIMARAYTFSENLLFSDPVSVILDGGYADAGFSGTPGYTTVHGTMKISNGKVTVRRVKIR